MDLSQAVGIVTGGASGFGKAFAEKILAAGGKVLITDVNGALLETTGKELQAKYGAKNIIWTRQNVTDAGGFVAAFDKASKFFSTPVNLLVNNAGIAGDLSFFDDGAPRNWEKVINIDLFALIRGTQVAMDNFKKHLNGREGVVVNLASLAGLNPVPFSPEYAAAKAGVVGFTRSLYQLKASHNIRVFALCPAFTNTAMGIEATQKVSQFTSELGGLMDISEIADAFVDAVKEPDNAGRCLRIVKGKRGYYRFAGDKLLFPNSKL
jgi:NAD(P)-dependent dehydrogenase (short-subunit alcohol dehydrogenase family)